MSWSGDVHGAERDVPVRWSIAGRNAEPDGLDLGRRAARAPSRRARRAAPPATRAASAARRSPLDARRSRRATPARIFVPPRSTPMTRLPVTRRVPYFAGWRRTTSPTASIGVVASRARCRRCPAKTRPAAARTPARRRRRGPARARRLRLPAGSRGSSSSWSSLLVLVVLVVAWGVAGYLVLPERRLGREQALRPRARRDAPRSRRATASCSATATTILLLGTDSSTVGGPQRRPALRLDHAPAHRPVAPPALVPLDPARPARARRRASATRRSTRPTRRAARRSRSGRCTTSPASRSTTS